MIDGLVYLASPYSHDDPAVMEKRFDQVCRHAAHLTRTGWVVYSPIAHTHPIAQHGLPTGWDFWEKYDREFLDRCSGMVVLRLDGWLASVGVRAEEGIMRAAGKQIEYHDYWEG
jgi:hypothetical protein